MESPSRDRILEAAQRVYAEHGFRGATTRRIAEVAGVNEVTLFRIFGGKDALLAEAIRPGAQRREVVALPDEPIDPERELTAWVAANLAFLRERRSIIRKTMSEMEERPQFAACVREGPQYARQALKGYLAALAAGGWLGEDVDARAAIAMLIGVIFSDAMGREMMPDHFPPLSAAPRSYSRLFLRAIGLRPRPARVAAKHASSTANGRRPPVRPSNSR
ncbi:MAG TPA: helix-turn-helix domain-containing protein [Gemmatimonadaceae bacterium]